MFLKDIIGQEERLLGEAKEEEAAKWSVWSELHTSDSTKMVPTCPYRLQVKVRLREPSSTTASAQPASNTSLDSEEGRGTREHSRVHATEACTAHLASQQRISCQTRGLPGPRLGPYPGSLLSALSR